MQLAIKRSFDLPAILKRWLTTHFYSFLIFPFSHCDCFGNKKERVQKGLDGILSSVLFCAFCCPEAQEPFNAQSIPENYINQFVIEKLNYTMWRNASSHSNNSNLLIWLRAFYPIIHVLLQVLLMYAGDMVSTLWDRQGCLLDLKFCIKTCWFWKLSSLKTFSNIDKLLLSLRIAWGHISTSPD